MAQQQGQHTLTMALQRPGGPWRQIPPLASDLLRFGDPPCPDIDKWPVLPVLGKAVYKCTNKIQQTLGVAIESHEMGICWDA